MNTQIDAIRKQINDRAHEFCLDNPRLLGLHLQIETAMLIGASIALGMPLDPDDTPEDVHNLTDTPEGEELLRQLFEGDVLSDEEQRKFAEEVSTHHTCQDGGAPCQACQRDRDEGRCPCGERSLIK